MITEITGLPGAGKTSLLIERYFMPLAAKGWLEEATTPDGEKVKVKRRLFTNINGLLLEHEKIDESHLQNWQEWVKPGDIIAFDEAQKPWPLTATGKAQDKCITELETHRHYGVDFFLCTQHPMLLNAAIARLAGQHLHVRKLGNSRYATVYEWDGVSRTLLYKNSFAKKPWRRSKAVEKVYRSSSLHTKQRRALPTVMFLVLLALGAFAYLGPSVYGKIMDRVHPERVLVREAAPVKTGLAAALDLPKGSEVKTLAPDAPKAEEVAFSGCAATAKRCTCFDSKMQQVAKPMELCRSLTGIDGPPPIDLAKFVIPEQALHELQLARADYRDLEMLAASSDRGKRQVRPSAVGYGQSPWSPAQHGVTPR